MDRFYFEVKRKKGVLLLYFQSMYGIVLEYYFTCPYCWEDISMLLDSSILKQTYIEDCEVCCNPIEVTTRFLNLELIEFQAKSIEQ